MFQATRRRLALWYTALTAVLLLLFALSFYLYVRHTLIERIDDTLSHVAEVVERSLVIEPASDGLIWMLDGRVSQQVNVEASFRNNILFTNDDDHIDLEWFNSQGKLLWSTFSDPLDLPLRTLHSEGRWPVGDRRNGETVAIQPGSYGEAILLRQMTVSVQIGRQVLGYLRVSHPWFEVTKPTQQLIWDLAAGLALVLGAVTAMGWFLSGLAMRPVQESYQRLKQFTADASHELRNPIAIIQANIQATLAEPLPDSHIQQQLQVVERLTRRLGRLVDDLLFLARQDSGMIAAPWESVPLDELLLEVVEEQQANASDRGVTLQLAFQWESLEGESLGKGLLGEELQGSQLQDQPQDQFQNQFQDQLQAGEPRTVAATPPSACPSCSPGNGAEGQSEDDSSLFLEEGAEVQGDRQQLARLFTNLISNGLQYTPAGGEVLVQLQRSTAIGARNKVIPTWAVTVADTGPGIGPEDLPHIFDRFYRVDPARSHHQTQGSGLGLAIVHAIVQTHQGQIQVQSQLHQGTCFTVTLPTSSLCLPQKQEKFTREG